MKYFMILFQLLALGVGAFAANGDDKCSLGLAKKFTDAIIAVEVEENSYRPGKLVFKRSESQEYTLDYLNEQIDLVGDTGGKYASYRDELVKHPNRHIYRMKYKWDADDNLDLGFYYIVKLNAYDGGCALDSIVGD